MKDEKWNDGFWNGEPARFRVVDIIVGEEPQEQKEHFAKHYPGQKRYMWFAPFIGKKLQAIEIHYQDETWLIDNSTGSGLHKITLGMGSPKCGHASIYSTNIIGEVEEKDWITPSEELYKKREQETHDYWMAQDPEGYSENLKKLEGLKKIIQKGYGNN